MNLINKNILLAFVWLMLNVITGFSNQVNFHASAPAVVGTGEQFRLVFQLNASGTNLKLPVFDGFQIVMGPSTSSSTSVQYINGQMTRTQTTSYTFILQALREGTFSVDPAQITVDGNIVKSNPLTIEVVAGQKSQSPATSSQQSSPPVSSAEIGDDAGLFIRAIVSKSNVYHGEPIIVTFKLYTKLEATNIENAKPPALNGFFQQEIEIPPLQSLDREIVNGEVYGTGVLRKVILFPQRSGELMIDPYELDVIVREQTTPSGRGFFDDFFGSSQLVRKKAVSPKIKINVKPLPANKPSAFSGAVGNFSIQAGVDKSQTKTNEPITYSIKLSGTGNLKLLEQPKVDFPIGFEVFDAKVNEAIKNTESGSSGSKSFEILIIPRNQGTYRIPSVNFSYFDPVTADYKSLRTGEITLHVDIGDETAGNVSVTGFTKEDVKIIGQDIRFIKLNKPVFRISNKVFFGSTAFFMAYVTAILIFLLLILFRRKHVQFNSDLQKVRNRRARKMARRRLKKAFKLLTDKKNQEFYEEILLSVWGYLGDKLNIPLSQLSRSAVYEKLEGHHDIQQELSSLFTLIDNCEAARYSPDYIGSEVKVVYNDAAQLIEKIENKIQL